jgi:hypothetical protein
MKRDAMETSDFRRASVMGSANAKRWKPKPNLVASSNRSDWPLSYVDFAKPPSSASVVDGEDVGAVERRLREELAKLQGDWVEKKIRRHMARARNRKGFGWKRWSRQWLYESLRLYNGYKVRTVPPWLTFPEAPL